MYFQVIRLSKPIPFFGRFVENVTVSTAGGILMGDPEDPIPVPSYIAAFFTNKNVGDGDSFRVKTNEKDDWFVVEWTKFFLKAKLTAQALVNTQGEVILSYKDSMAALSTSFQAGDQILIGAADSFAVAKNESFEIYSYGSVDIPTNQVSSDKSIVSLRFMSDPDIVRCQFGQVEKWVKYIVSVNVALLSWKKN